ncbi:MAG: hypothetical protein ACOYCB_10025 [Fastidiosipilaceae bacterium]
MAHLELTLYFSCTETDGCYFGRHGRLGRFVCEVGEGVEVGRGNDSNIVTPIGGQRERQGVFIGGFETIQFEVTHKQGLNRNRAEVAFGDFLTHNLSVTVDEVHAHVRFAHEGFEGLGDSLNNLTQGEGHVGGVRTDNLRPATEGIVATAIGDSVTAIGSGGFNVGGDNGLRAIVCAEQRRPRGKGGGSGLLHGVLSCSRGEDTLKDNLLNLTEVLRASCVGNGGDRRTRRALTCRHNSLCFKLLCIVFLLCGGANPLPSHRKYTKPAQIKQIFCKFFTECLELSKIIPTFVGERIALAVLGIPKKET